MPTLWTQCTGCQRVLYPQDADETGRCRTCAPQEIVTKTVIMPPVTPPVLATFDDVIAAVIEDRDR